MNKMVIKVECVAEKLKRILEGKISHGFDRLIPCEIRSKNEREKRLLIAIVLILVYLLCIETIVLKGARCTTPWSLRREAMRAPDRSEVQKYL